MLKIIEIFFVNVYLVNMNIKLIYFNIEVIFVNLLMLNLFNLSSFHFGKFLY